MQGRSVVTVSPVQDIASRRFVPQRERYLTVRPDGQGDTLSNLEMLYRSEGV